MKPSNIQEVQFAKTTGDIWAALLLSLLVSSCGGGGGSTPAATTVISGVVFDEAVGGATVTATSLSSGQSLGNTTTGANGSYSLTVPTAQIGTGYSLASTGGTMNGLPFSGSLSALYASTANPQQANLTLLTSALASAANNTTLYPGTVLQKQSAVLADSLSSGVLTPDYFMVAPSGSSATRLAVMQNQAQSLGVSAAIQNAASIINTRPILGGCGATDIYCNFEVSNLGESFTKTFSGATISAPTGAFSSCMVVASFNIADQSMTMHLENIQPTTNSTLPDVCKISGNVTLELPSSAAEAPGACLPLSGVKSVPNCVTTYAGMTPNYLVDDGIHSHRTDKNPHSSKPALHQEIKFSRSYGAVLSASSTRSNITQNQWAGKTAVIFVNGFQPTLFGLGGGDGTWGNLPNLVIEDPSYVALNFQWLTDASYLTVASELAKAVEYAYLSTGRKVHIVAHSFGGVLSRTMLQNLNGDAQTALAASHVATLTTVGTPHSGIADGGIAGVGVPWEVEGYFLPQGWGSWIADKFCGQISCYQSGLNANIAQWAKDELACPAGIPTCPAGTIPTRGYINARLADLKNHPLPTGLSVRVLIGQIINTTQVISIYVPGSDTFGTDDGLISYYGQRFIPQSGRNPLLSGKVTERILGLDMGVNAFPDDPAGNIPISPYAYSGGTSKPAIPPFRYGYKHSTFWATLGTGGKDATVFNSEVNVPASCGTAATCQHDTWLNIKEVLNTCPAGQVIQSGQCVTPPATGTIFSRPYIGENISLGAVTDFYQYYFMGYASLGNPPNSPNFWIATQDFNKVRVKRIGGTATCSDMGFDPGRIFNGNAGGLSNGLGLAIAV
jgi:pimeloyl-ACP methyl ester carboxylesterase